MAHASTSFRDVLSVTAVVLSVAALATNGPPDISLKEAQAQPKPRGEHVAEGRTLWPAEPARIGHTGRPARDRRFDTIESDVLRSDVAAVDRLNAQTIRAREFIVVDEQWRDRATVEVDGGDVLRFTAGNDKMPEAFALSVFPDGRAAFLFRDDRGRNRVAIAIAEDGRPFISLTDSPSISLEDERAQSRIVLRLGEDGRPSLRMDDESIRPEEAPAETPRERPSERRRSPARAD